MNDKLAPKIAMISAEQVADYLNEHRDFFADRLSLLADMHLLHDTGDAVSLLERQMAILRQRNADLHERMNQLLDNARDNDVLFEKTKRLVLKLIDTKALNDTVNVLLHSFHNDFGIQHISLLIYDDCAQTLVADSARSVLLSEAKEHLHSFIDNHNAICGHLSTEEQTFIFGDQAPAIHSTAVIPLKHHTPIGLLAIGHRDPKYFHAGIDTLFLSYIGDALARLLQKNRLYANK